MAWRVARGVARALPLVGFSTATIFGFHVSSKSDSDRCRDAQKNVRSANMAFVSSWGAFFIDFSKLDNANLRI